MVDSSQGMDNPKLGHHAQRGILRRPDFPTPLQFEPPRRIFLERSN